MSTIYRLFAAIMVAVYFVSAPAFGQGVNVEIEGERRPSSNTGGGERPVLEIDRGVGGTSSQNAYTGEGFIALTLYGGGYDTTHTPETRDGGGPYIGAIIRGEWNAWSGDQDKETGKRWSVFTGPIALGNLFQFTDNTFKMRGGMLGLGWSFTLTQADGYVLEEDENEFGSMYFNFNAMLAYKRNQGETRFDDFELKKDESWGVRLEFDWQIYALRYKLGKKVFQETEEDVLVGITGFLTNIQLTANVYIPFSDDREDSLVGMTSEGPDHLEGIARVRVDVFQVAFGDNVRNLLSFGPGGAVSMEDRMRRDGDFRLSFDPRAEVFIRYSRSDWCYVFVSGEYIWRQNNRDAEAATLNLAVTFVW